MSAAPSKIIAETRRSGALLVLTLNAPKANILDSAMMAGIEEALHQHEQSPALKGILFKGAGDHFCFGASVEEHRPEQAAAMLSRFHGLFRKLSALGIPTLSAVSGQCLGGGLELASYCTWIFAHPASKFGQPEMKLAVFPPMASIVLPWRIGGGRAMDLCISGRSVDAAYAKHIGLVHEIGDNPEAMAEQFFAEYLEPLSASSLRFAEKAARHSLNERFKTDLPAIEELYLEELMRTPDAREGIAAFLEKRKPQYGAPTPSPKESTEAT